MIDYLIGEKVVPIVRACTHMELARSSCYQRTVTRAKADELVMARKERHGFEVTQKELKNPSLSYLRCLLLLLPNPTRCGL